MAEATRMKDLQEAQKRLETEHLKRDDVEKKMQEQISNLGTEVKGLVGSLGEEVRGFDSKFEKLTSAIASLQLQFQNSNKGKGVVEEGSILGEPPSHLKSDVENFKPQYSNRGREFSDSRRHRASNSPPRVDFPSFDGTNSRAWIVKCNNYFKIVKNVEEDQKVAMASMYFEGRAALWYHSFSAENNEVSWGQFVEILSARFEELRVTQIVDDFNKIKLTGSYDEFVEKYEELRECMRIIYGDILNEEYYIGSFMSGLPPELKSAIKMMKPTTVQSAIDMGRDQLETIDAITRKIKFSTRPFNNSNGLNTNKPAQQTSVSAAIPSNTARPQVKLLTSAEMAARRARGLCFNCDERFFQGHKCKNRAYLIMSEEEELNYMQAPTDDELLGNEDGEAEDEAQVSLNAINGSDGIATMRFVGIYGEHKLQILIDTGSTLSFIRESTAMRLNYPLDVVAPLQIRVANGQKMISSHMATNFVWELQGHTHSHSLRLLQNEGCDIILGCDWVKTHTPVEFDYERMRVTARLNGKKIRMQSLISTATCQYISHHTLYKLMHSQARYELEEVYHVMPQKPDFEGDNINNKDLTSVLKSYEDIFKEPQGLPPVTELPPTTDEGLFRLHPCVVVDRRTIHRGREGVSQLLVCWEDEKSDLFSWEDEKYIAKKFPEFDPWGQGSSNGGGIVVGMSSESGGGRVTIVAVTEEEGADCCVEGNA